MGGGPGIGKDENLKQAEPALKIVVNLQPKSVVRMSVPFASPVLVFMPECYGCSDMGQAA